MARSFARNIVDRGRRGHRDPPHRRPGRSERAPDHLPNSGQEVIEPVAFGRREDKPDRQRFRREPELQSATMEKRD